MKAQDHTIWGRKPVEEALINQVTISKIFLQKGVSGPFEKLIRHECKRMGIPYSVVPKERMNRMVRSNHQGVIAWISPIDFVDFEQLVLVTMERESLPLLIMLEGISDTHNLGAIARSAWYLGAHGLVVSASHSAPINALTVKSSAGAILQIPVSRVSSVVNSIEFLKLSGFTVIATDLQGHESLDKLEADVPIVLIMGAEGTGISTKTKTLADYLYKIPAARPFDSLNVSVAAGICLFEILKNRQNLFGQ